MSNDEREPIGDFMDRIETPVDFEDREDLIEKCRSLEPPGCPYSEKCWDGYISEWSEEEERWVHVQECKCRREARREADYKDTLTTLHGEDYVPGSWKSGGTFEAFQEDEQPEAYQAARRYVENFRDKVAPGGHWLYICGEVGLGKTHLVWACYHELREKSVPAYVVSAPEFIEQLRPGHDNQELRLSFAKKTDFLAIDDFLRHRIDSDHVFDIFSDLLDYRYEWELPTMITSQYSISELSEETGRRWDPLQDRIAGRSTEVNVTGESYRVKGGDSK